jgi:hypothetical protein
MCRLRMDDGKLTRDEATFLMMNFEVGHLRVLGGEISLPEFNAVINRPLR